MNIRPPHPIWVPRLDAGLELAHVDVQVYVQGDVRLCRAKRDHGAVNVMAMQMF